MDEIIRIHAFSENGDQSDCGTLRLPATAYQLWDVSDRLHRDGADGFSMLVRVFEKHDFLRPFLNSRYDQCGPKKLYELNALAQRLSELDDLGIAAFKGLLKMEKPKGPIELPRLINLAYSTECCHVVYEALNDSQLGRFLAENGLAPETEGVPDSVFEMLDFEQIGRRHRAAEGSVFVERDYASPGAYVERHDNIVEAYKELELEPKAPDYTALLNLAYGGKTARLKLPADDRDLSAALDLLGAPDWTGVWRGCSDCAVPSLTQMISEEPDLSAINSLARELADIGPESLTACKALLEAAECGDLQRAGALLGELGEYTFSPQPDAPAQYAMDALSAILPEKDAAQLIPHLDLRGYGQALLQDRNAVMTSFGLIQRKDGQPIQAIETQPEQGGMEMM